jgi:hypothetical protein
MLAEKFFLVLETLNSHAEPDGIPRAASGSPSRPFGDLIAALLHAASARTIRKRELG